MALAAIVGLVIGAIIGMVIGIKMGNRSGRQASEILETQLSDKERSLAEENTAREEERASMIKEHAHEIESYKASEEELKKKLHQAQKETQQLKRWADRQCRQLFDEFRTLWVSKKLPESYEEMVAYGGKKNHDSLRNQAEKLQIWMEQLSVSTPESLYLLGLWHTMEGHEREANAMFSEAAKKGLGLQAWLSLGDSYWDIQKQEKARDAYLHCMKSDDLPDRVFIRVASIAITHREYDEALLALERILSRKKNPLEVFTLAGHAYGMLHQDEKAIEVCEAGLKLYPDSPELLTKMIIPLTRLGRWEDAEASFQRALDLDASFAEAPLSMGVAHMHHGEDKKAVTFLKQALSLEERYPEALFCLGIIQNRQQKYKKALEYFQKAVEYKPDYAEAYYNMKESYEGLKDFDKAIAVLKKATTLNPAYK
ncbi:MAG TPA: tetratricopeptide repeat protein [Thermoanaerobaculia bacterium]|mgnify:CR=1 FL=1|nr:tetratricopeptide repeat protein [Thermoanaerobaculia bacterium]HUM28763.1 tetratricopeptide repeat protein [Thermoanaerobaculia bacterium]HXK67987.1 tetratricopeptide repeat protein [Thermoanaerobaculia bacterium]